MNNRALTKNVYTAGGMERSKDGGALWRTVITPMLASVGYTVFNPCVSEQERLGISGDKIQEIMSLAKKNHDFLRLRRIMAEIKKTDLDAIDASDIVVVYLDHLKSKPGGTYEELMYSKQKGKVILGLCLGKLENENSWVVDSCVESGGWVFMSYEDLIAHIRKQVNVYGYEWIYNIPNLPEGKE